ncbi:hypothetical protein [Agromyces cerinus]|uniref:PH domain-containing protein n=1 Tax=Agromyces cerinus subsp. cerinus TaxID=232089 RepID=A0A1N6DDP3_9MICO|nr:hypothetical protein [Agromyces cerinus]SIN68837.1 hypothetical protein SAMN05443544_0060 [Agromyces cerinus subsp. cerinus]
MITLRPRRTLGRSVGLPIAALALPVLAAEVWLMDSSDAWRLVAVTAATVLAVILVAWIGYRRANASISRYGIVERGFFGGVSTVAARDVAGVLRVQLYRANSLDTTQELFVVERTGRGAFRMRGRFWDERTMNRVAEMLGVEETVGSEPMTLSELREANPRLLYWFERRSLTR